MDEAAAQPVIDEFCQEHRGTMSYVALDTAREDLQRLLAMVPGGGEWAVAADAPRVFVVALNMAETLFVISVRADDGRATMTSQPLSSNRIRVALKSGPARPSEAGTVKRTTHWTFRYRDRKPTEPWQRIDGEVSTRPGRAPERDQRERFARELASQAGWEPPDPRP